MEAGYLCSPSAMARLLTEKFFGAEEAGNRILHLLVCIGRRPGRVPDQVTAGKRQCPLLAGYDVKNRCYPGAIVQLKKWSCSTSWKRGAEIGHIFTGEDY